MILPSKNLDLDISPLFISSKILNNHAGKKIKFDSLREEIKNDIGDYYWLILLRSLNFLFLTGVVIYNQEDDTLEFVNAN
jgi:hypothetical protein